MSEIADAREAERRERKRQADLRRGIVGTLRWLDREIREVERLLAHAQGGSYRAKSLTQRFDRLWRLRYSSREWCPWPGHCSCGPGRHGKPET